MLQAAGFSAKCAFNNETVNKNNKSINRFKLFCVFRIYVEETLTLYTDFI